MYLLTFFFKRFRKSVHATASVKFVRKRRSNESRNQIYINQCFYSRILDLFIFAVFLLAQNKSKSIWIMGPWRGKEIWLLKLPKLMIHKKNAEEWKNPRSQIKLDVDISRIFSLVFAGIKIYSAMCLCWHKNSMLPVTNSFLRVCSFSVRE